MRYFAVCVCAVFLCLEMGAQSDSSLYVVVDSAFRANIKTATEEATEKLQSDYRERLSINKQAQLFSALRKVFQQTSAYLERGIDTIEIDRDLHLIKLRSDVAAEGIFNSRGSIQSARNLATSATMLHEIRERATERQDEIEKYLSKLETFRISIDSISGDSMLFYLPADSAELVGFVTDLSYLMKEIGSTEKNLDKVIKSVRNLRFRTVIVQNEIVTRVEGIESYRKDLSTRSFLRETGNIWQWENDHRPLKSNLKYSLNKSVLVLWFYFSNHWLRVLILLLLIFILGNYLKNLKINIIATMGAGSGMLSNTVTRYPGSTAAIIVLSVGQFIFPAPPFALFAIIWTVASLLLLLVLWDSLHRLWRRYFIIFLVLTIIVSAFNMLLHTSQFERFVLAACAALGLGFAIMNSTSNIRKEMQEKRLMLFIGIFIVFVFISLVANTFGRYNLAKGMLTAGYFNLQVGLLLLYSLRFLNEVFTLSAEAYREDEKKRYYIDFEKLGKDAPAYLYIFLLVGWFILVGRNFYIYDQITEPISEIIHAKHKIGSLAFSVGGIVLFVSVILVAGLASKIVSYFAGNNSSEGVSAKKGGLGSWLLLIRIAIISVGVLFAFAISGIALDKIAIIFGALSVGIGFGLQNVVNNLVSGLIIAFEKPLSIGDVVEIGGQMGTMKSIGFRSSVVSTFDGSDVIIPNGELLNNHLINWTLNDSSRRVEIVVGVHYNTNLDEVTELVTNLISEDDRIRKYPEPVVLVKEFASSAIELKVLFWVHNDWWIRVKSDTMRSIKRAFDAAEIEIPFPQMVLHNTEEVLAASESQGGEMDDPPAEGSETKGEAVAGVVKAVGDAAEKTEEEEDPNTNPKV